MSWQKLLKIRGTNAGKSQKNGETEHGLAGKIVDKLVVEPTAENVSERCTLKVHSSTFGAWSI